MRNMKLDDTQESSLWEDEYLQDDMVYTVYVIAPKDG